LFNPAKLSEQMFITLCALPEGYGKYLYKWNLSVWKFHNEKIPNKRTVQNKRYKSQNVSERRNKGYI